MVTETAIFPRLNSALRRRVVRWRHDDQLACAAASRGTARGPAQRARVVSARGGNPLHRLDSYDPYRLPIGAPAADAAAVGGGAAEHARVHF